MKIHNVVSGQLQKELYLDEFQPEPRYGHVVLVSGYLNLTAVN